MKELFRFNLEKYDILEYMDYNSIEDMDMIFVNRKKKNLKFEPRNRYSTENIFVENYGNLLSTVSKSYVMVVVSEVDDKVSVKLFVGSKKRVVGNRFFIQRKSVYFLTFNKKTGDYFAGKLINFNLKKKKVSSITKNSYHTGSLAWILQLIRHNFSSITKTNQDILWVVESVKNAFIRAIDGDENMKTQDVLLKKYLDTKGIKYPNNFWIFYESYDFKTTKSHLKHHNYKIVDAYMKQFSLKGDNVKKALHNCKNLNIGLLVLSYTIFSEHTINSDYDLVLSILNYNDSFLSFYLLRDYDTLTMSKKEKKICFDFFREIATNKSMDVNTFLEHLTFYRELKGYGEKIKWRSNSVEFFREEHLDWVDKISFYKKGNYYRVYSEKLISKLKDPITVSNHNYYPVLLCKTEEFNRESMIQSNCVKTYIGRPSSIILSLRKDSEVSEERATIEYQITKIGDGLDIRRVQSLGKYNNRLSDEWDKPLSKLDSIMEKFSNNNDFETVKIKKVLIDGSELFSDSHFSEDGRLIWSFNKIVS